MTSKGSSGVLYLHAGPHKTGTTSIQKAVDLQHDALTKRGIHPYREAHKTQIPAFNAYELAHEFLRPELRTPMRRQDGAAEFASGQRWARFQDFVRTRVCGEAVLLSAEAFSFSRTAAELAKWQACCRSLFDRVEILLVRRRDQDWRRSWTAQVARSGLYADDSPCRDVPQAARIDQDWYFNWTGVMRFWQALGRVTVLDYDAEIMRRTSVLPGFFEWLGHVELADPLNIFLNKSKRDPV